MRRIRKVHVFVAAFTVALCVPASGVGGGSGLPTKIGKGEGALNVIEWPAYADKSFANKFVQQTGCKIHRKDAGSSNQMVALMRTGGGGGGGQYDLVSASGDASLRLILGGDVQPVNINLIPSWKDFVSVFKSPAHNTVKGVHYGVSVQWGPNTLIYNTKKVKPAPTSWSALYSSKYKGKITVPNNPIQIADAALYLMKSKPSLGIRDPYELNKSQFNAAVSLLKQQKKLLKRYWDRGDVALPDARPTGEEDPCQGNHPQRRSNGVGRHMDARQEGAASELRVPMDEIRHHPSGGGETGARVRRDSGQPEGLPVHEQDRGWVVREIPPEPAALVLQANPLLEDPGARLR